MISYQMKVNAEDQKVESRIQIAPTLSSSAMEALKSLAEEFNTKPTTVAGEIIELCHGAWAIQKRRYDAWMRRQMESAVNELPEDQSPGSDANGPITQHTRSVPLSTATPFRKKDKGDKQKVSKQ